MPKATQAERIAAVRSWQSRNPDRVRAANYRYEQAHKEQRKEQKREWWRKHKGLYGTRRQYEITMQQTGGIGASSSTGWQRRPGANPAGRHHKGKGKGKQ